MKRIAIINASTVATDAMVSTWVAAIQTQLTRDFAPAWGIDVSLEIVARGAKLPTDRSWCALLDDADQAGVGGYHDVTSTGLPMAKVFVRTAMNYKIPPSLPFSHELLELPPDPDVNLLVRVGRNSFAYETADPVESVAAGYQINGVLVSDFVWPCYFQTFLTNRQMDQRGLLKAPIPAMLPGGYLIYQTPQGAWKQIYGDAAPSPTFLYRARPHPGSRRLRRMIGREEWVRSTVEVAP